MLDGFGFDKINRKELLEASKHGGSLLNIV